MITETAFIGADNLPQEMADALDLPWNFVGDIGPKFMPSGDVGPYNVMIPCHHGLDPTELVSSARIYAVQLRGYLFITDDLIEVRVYFGL
jgi:hypothetical protein